MTLQQGPVVVGSEAMAVGPFPGGINLIDPPGKLQPDELLAATNTRLAANGVPYKRPGYKKFGSTPAKINGNNLVNFLFRFIKSDGAKYFVGAAGGKLGLINDATGIATQITIAGSSSAVMETTAICRAFVYKNRLYILDGTKPQRYNGVDDLYTGGFVHSVAGWASAGGTGGALTLLATYKYIMTDVAADMGEGPASAAFTVTLSGANNKITLSSLDAAPANTESTFKNIYRTLANGSVYYFLAQISTGTNNYVDVTADTALGAQFVPSHIPRATARFAILGPDDRIYYCGMVSPDASLVEASDVGFPDRCLDSDFFTVANNDNDTITGLGSVPGGVVFFKRNSMWLLRYFGAGLIRISPSIGCAASNSITQIPVGDQFYGGSGAVLFVSQRGEVYVYNGYRLEEIGRKIRPELQYMPESAIARMVATYQDFRYQLSYDYRGVKGYNWKTLEYDFVGKKWDGPHTNLPKLTPSIYCAWDTTRDNGQLTFGEAQSGVGSYVYVRDEYTYNDDGSLLPMTYKTGPNAVDSGRSEDIVYRALAKITATPDAQLTISVVLSNLQKITSVFASTLANLANALVWGVGVWGVNTWGGYGGQDLEATFDAGARDYSPQFEITDKGSATRISIDELEVMVRKLPRK